MIKNYMQEKDCNCFLYRKNDKQDFIVCKKYDRY